MATSQFDFLRAEFKQIFVHCERAELHCRSDPRVSAWSGRLALEAALKLFFRHAAFLPDPDPRATAGELLRERAFRTLDKGYPFRLASKIVDVGNRGSHDDSSPPAEREVVVAVENLFNFMSWFAAQVSQADPKASPGFAFDRGALPARPPKPVVRVTIDDLLTPPATRARVLDIVRLDGRVPPKEPLSEADVDVIRRDVSLARQFETSIRHTDLSPDERALLLAVAGSMPDDIWELEQGFLLTERMYLTFEEVRTSAVNTADRYRFRRLLANGELADVLAAVDSVGPHDDQLIVAVARAWKMAYSGHERADWRSLVSLDATIAIRLASVLVEQCEVRALAKIPDDLFAHASGVLGPELGFDITCARLLDSPHPTQQHVLAFLDAWKTLQERREDGRAVILASTLIQRTREHLRSTLWRIAPVGDLDIHRELAELVLEVAPDDEIALLAAGLSGEAGVLAGIGEPTVGWASEIRTQFLAVAGLMFIGEGALREVAESSAGARGDGSRLGVSDLLQAREARDLITEQLPQFDLDRNRVHQAIACSLSAEALQRLNAAVATTIEKIESLETRSST